MADNRTMAQLLQAPTEGYEDAIVIPEINANFELKHGLINTCSKQTVFFCDMIKRIPHAHIRYFIDYFNNEIPGDPNVDALTTEVSDLKKYDEDYAYCRQTKSPISYSVKAVEQAVYLVEVLHSI
ncbi:hypothetical protein Tco_0642683 [Tanacetum coccineum]